MNKWIRDAVAEGIGVFALCFIGILALNAAALNGLTGIALAHGLIIAVMVAAFGHVSGGHFNPAITLGLLLSGRISTATAGLYWLAQLFGGLLAALAIAWIGTKRAVAAGTPQLAEGAGITVGKGILLEAIATFFLVLVVFGTAVDRFAPKSVYPFAIGLTITAGILAIGSLTGGALNPARGFGPALVGGEWSAWGAWLIGPLLGAVLAWAVHDYVLTPREAAEPVTDSGERDQV
ncbi:MAG: aquaporin [Sporichthyaceae bacterium]|nr:aquaporin [Sporichthyaceae bacterium]